eukprot:s637_g3.t1
MGPAPLPRATNQAWATSSGSLVVAPTDKAQFYRSYLDGNPKELTRIKGVPPIADVKLCGRSEVMCEWVGQGSGGDSGPEAYLGKAASEAEDWESWHRIGDVLGSSASQRLLRKRRVVTNASDAVRYKAAGEEGNQVFLDVVPEECPVMPEPRGD